MENSVPHARPGITCPLHRRDVSKVCHTCAWWVGLQWQNDKTMQWEEKWDCAMPLLAKSQTDVVRMTARSAKATDDMKEEITKRAVSPPAWAVEQIVRDTLAADTQLAADARQLSLGMSEDRLLEGPGH